MRRPSPVAQIGGTGLDVRKPTRLSKGRLQVRPTAMGRIASQPASLCHRGSLIETDFDL